MNRLLSLLAVLFLALTIARAQGPDEQYVRIYQLIQDADRLNDSGDSRGAAAKYVEAQRGLTVFRGNFPGWNDRVINYRLNYVATKLAPLASLIASTPAPASTKPNETAPTTAPTTNPATTPAPTTPTTAPVWSAEFDQQLKALQEEVARLQTDNRTLTAKLKEALSVQPAPLDPRDLAKAEERIRTLQKENELFKAQMASKPGAESAAPAPELMAKFSEQSDTIAALRTENEVLKKQTGEWREKYDTLSSSAETARAQFTAQLAENEAAMRKLTGENINLQKQTELWKQVAQSNQRQVALASIPAMPAEAQRELLALRARVQTLEAKPVPYTTDELALFNKPAPTLPGNFNIGTSSTTPAISSTPGAELPARKISRGTPPGAGQLALAAERAFGTQRYGEAEQKYAELLRQDENNVTTLGNLASAQVELGRFAEAEKSAQRALAIDPDDYFSLYVIGRLRFREDKLDAALDALSRSAKANPDYADTQNYLGIVLSEKGQRVPAEAALRRAIQLQPDNAVAHNNLAVVYATQAPPALALARWHYQKARAAGHPKNAALEKMLEPKP